MCSFYFVGWNGYVKLSKGPFNRTYKTIVLYEIGITKLKSPTKTHALSIVSNLSLILL